MLLALTKLTVCGEEGRHPINLEPYGLLVTL